MPSNIKPVNLREQSDYDTKTSYKELRKSVDASETSFEIRIFKGPVWPTKLHRKKKQYDCKKDLDW